MRNDSGDVDSGRADAHEPIVRTRPESHFPVEPASDDQPPDDTASADGLDLLSIGLAVFFVALIATVGAMLILPRILSGG